MSPKLGYDPFALLKCEVRLWPEDVDPLGDAASAFDARFPEPLLSLLRSNDLVVVSSGLYVFGELGSKAVVALDAALLSVDHPNRMARASLVEGISSNDRSLSPHQLNKLIPLIDDEDDLVRMKMIAVLGAVRLETLRQAIELLDCPDEQVRHAAGLQELEQRIECPQAFLDAALRAERLTLTYKLVSLQRAARFDQLMEAPIYEGEDFAVSGSLLNTRRLVRQNIRRAAKRDQGL